MTNERKCVNCGAPETAASCYWGDSWIRKPHVFETPTLDAAAPARADELEMLMREHEGRAAPPSASPAPVTEPQEVRTRTVDVSISHDDACLLSRVFNRHAFEHVRDNHEEPRINEFLKSVIVVSQRKIGVVGPSPPAPGERSETDWQGMALVSMQVLDDLATLRKERDLLHEALHKTGECPRSDCAAFLDRIDR